MFTEQNDKNMIEKIDISATFIKYFIAWGGGGVESHSFYVHNFRGKQLVNRPFTSFFLIQCKKYVFFPFFTPSKASLLI